MASKPYAEKRGGEYTGKWVMKWRPDPTGPWRREVLGGDPRLKGARPPKAPPQFVLDRHHEFVEAEYNAKHGINPARARAKGLDGYLEDYVESFARSHKPGSVRQLRRHARDFAAFAKGRGVASVQSVTRSVCRDYLEARKLVVSHDTLRTEVRYLAPVWSRAVEDGLMLANPWSRIKPPGKSTKGEGTVWTSDEVARIAAGCTRAWQSEFVMVLANTGLRISTALLLVWEWVRWREGEAGAIHIPKEAAAEQSGVKTAYTHVLSPFAHQLLFQKHALSKSGLVFPNPCGKRKGGVVPYDSARDAVQRAIDGAGVKPGTPHDLRRTYATLLYRGTKDLDLVRRQLGHTSLVTTQKYLGPVAADDAKSLSGFSVGDVTGHGPDPSPS